MTNPVRGVISHDLADRRLRLRLSVNEWCELEEELGKDCSQIISELFQSIATGRLNQTFLRALFRAAVSFDQPDITAKAAGDIMADVGMVESAALLGRVVAASMPEPDKKGGTEKPGERKGAAKPPA